MEPDERTVGLTTTIPVEVIFASGLFPMDLNNFFVSHPRRDELKEIAVREGFPQNTCAWLKGIFGAVVDSNGPRKVIGVVRGDCSGTEVLLEALGLRGTEVIPFSYPYPPRREDMEREIERLCEALGTSMTEAQGWVDRLAVPRERLLELDRLCWSENKVTGMENHMWLVSASDFGSDPEGFSDELGSFIEQVRAREPLDNRKGIPYRREVRLGYIGVPPITLEIFPLVESKGARFVFHEVQRQFVMLEHKEGLADMYLAYTYPYTLEGRAGDINEEAERRKLDGLVHYVQSFCHRNLEDVIFSRELTVPVLTVECDCPGELSAPSRARLENFIQVLGENL